MRKTITLLTILLLVVFMVGCENSINPIDSQNQSLAKSDGETMSLAKKGCTSIQSGELRAEDGTVIETGFDKYGYNYQGHMFKGRYCDSDRVEGGDYCDVNLLMKWNDAWLSNQDCDGDLKLDRSRYIGSGAWLTNHQSGEYEVDGKTCKWNYFVKIIAVPADAFSPWVLSGDFVFDLHSSKTYTHELHIVSFNEDDGTFIATGINTTDNNKTTTATGTILGDKFTMELVQLGGWTGVFVGDIATNGAISGTWNDGSGDFEFTDGKAIHTTWFSAEGTEIGPVIWGSFAIIQQVENDPCAGIHGLQWISPDRAGLGGW